jgi:hypothetical protein
MSKFKKDQSGNSRGRPKGTVNKKTLERAIQVSEIVCRANFCPFTEMVNIAKNSPDSSIKLTACKELAQYIAPKLRSVELTGDMGNPVSFEINTSES